MNLRSSAALLCFGAAIIIATLYVSFMAHPGKVATPEDPINGNVAETPECTIHVSLGHQGQQGVISLKQSPDTKEWPIFSNDVYSFTYPPDWKVSSDYSSTAAEYAAYVFPSDSPATQLGTAIIVTDKATTPSEIRNDISSHTSLPVEQLNCTLAGMPASVFNVGGKNYSYMLRVVLFGNHTVSYLTLDEPGQASPESLATFRAILNSFAESNPLPSKAS